MGDIPSTGTGLGSSSTVTVGALHAMYTYLGEIVPAERLAREACAIEIDTLGKPIGIQDQYIVAYGGLRFLEFFPDGTVQAEKVVLPPALLRQLNESLLLFYTGASRSAESILHEQNDNIGSRRGILRDIKELACTARQELQAGNVDIFGELLETGWNP